jgi:hypothetical protein
MLSEPQSSKLQAPDTELLSLVSFVIISITVAFIDTSQVFTFSQIYFLEAMKSEILIEQL